MIMTKLKQTTAASLLADVLTLVCDPRSTVETKQHAIKIAYEVGLSDGRLEGAKSMGDSLTAALERVT
jgi:hypothetical protein